VGLRALRFGWGFPSALGRVLGVREMTVGHSLIHELNNKKWYCVRCTLLALNSQG
jgi:hypothetical protein